MPTPNDAILIAVLAVLIIIIVTVVWKKEHPKGEGFKSDDPSAGFVSYTGMVVPPPYMGGKYNPYTVLNRKMEAVQPSPNDAYNQPPWYTLPQGLDIYNRSGASLKPQMISAAEQESWYAATGNEGSGNFNGDTIHEGFTDTSQWATPAPEINYNDYVTDLVVDPRTRDNHRRWVESMQPWSGTAMKVDNLDVEPTIDFIGLRRPQPVVQYNPMQLTEIDTEDLMGNHRFNFQD